MVEEAKDNGTVTEEEHFEYIISVMKRNDDFLRRTVDSGEGIDLIIDAIDLVGFAVEREKGREDYVKRSMIFFLHHILMPSSYAISTDLLIGNLPACFMELRLMLESMVKCYFADLRYPEQSVFQGKLKSLEDDLQENRITISKLMRCLGKKLGLEDGFYTLWRELSNDWIHTTGFVDTVVNQISQKSRTPAWALIIPMSYAEHDLDTIKKLDKRVSQFRLLLRATIENYKRETSFGEVREHD